MGAKRKKPAKPVVSLPKRVAWLEKRLAQGIRPTALVQLATGEWGVSESAVWRMLAEIKARWLEESAAKRPEARAEVLSQVDHLIASAYADGDLSTVTKALALKSELHGLRLRAVVDTTAAASALAVPAYLTTPRETPSAPAADDTPPDEDP